MNRIFILFLFLLGVSCTSQSSLISTKNISQIVQILSDDKMQGRGNFQEGLEKSADYISSEFKRLGLAYFADLQSYKQQFEVLEIEPKSLIISINYKKIKSEDCFFESKETQLEFTKENAILRSIRKEEDFRKRIHALKKDAKTDRPTIILVETTHRKIFERYKNQFQEKSLKLASIVPEPTLVFVLTDELTPNTIDIAFENQILKKPLHNVIGILEGKSKPKEYVIFSGHYDHLGIISPINGDSIANGADDDASGVAGMMALAGHFKTLNNNARTLIFVAFAAEEIGGYGSQFLAQKVRPNEIIAMLNFEMIGKLSKWGKNSAFITGFDKSDFGQILQRNSPETFRFEPDPYPNYNLFYRSDNKPFASLGIPAHTISTAPIDTDKLYHSPDDEFETLTPENLKNVIQATAKAVESIVSGVDTPQRLAKED